MESKDKSEGIAMPHENDVLSGRGNFVNYHPGNMYFRALVARHRLACAKCSSVNDKKQFSQLIFEEIRARPGRFLKQDNETKLWYDIGEKVAVNKVRQSLREGAPELLKGEGGESGDTEGGNSSEEETDGNRYGVSRVLDSVTSRQVIEFLQEASQVLEPRSVVRMISIFNVIKKGGITLNQLKDLVCLLDGNANLIERLDGFLQDELEFMSGKRGHKVIITTASTEAATMIQLWASPTTLGSVEVNNSARKKRKRREVTVGDPLHKESMQPGGQGSKGRPLEVTDDSVAMGETKVEEEDGDGDDVCNAEAQSERTKI